ncbi:protein TIC 100 [Macadamia integrifolia]|uniref:protein TIC 100 n=1 Tax=Macadamia integrifolia TaxID=60698 RepID=UPI001C4F3282|nr:protein TIC 100 [Macadamia integrifolia]
MEAEDSTERVENAKEQQNEAKDGDPSEDSSASESGSEDDNDDSSEEGYEDYFSDDEFKDDNSPEKNIKLFMQVLESKGLKNLQEEEERKFVFHEDRFNFHEDPENWREEDIKELWADAPLKMTKPGWDPVWADEEDWDVVQEEIKEGRDPPIAPFYLPYRKYYPAIPDNHFDISDPKSVIEELDRIEEFLKWVSYVFADGSSYEGTVWDDLAHGKGVYVAENGLVRYEGEWLQNNMEGHGVVEVDIPAHEPVLGSELEAKMRAEGKIISRDFMSPEDREWLEKDIEDSIRLAGGNYEIPFYENNEWIQQFGKKPEKGRYRYSGQWKHSRMHGCGVYEINERLIFGRFYFGELLEDSAECDEDVSALHAGIAEVAAAKARMFVNKPDGMVREERGPYSDPQHPYFYEEEDVWMAPGFINQFHEVPDFWKTYVHEVDEEREMWLNSFYKAPLRIPMPAELEYWWSKDESPEFVLLNKEPEPDPEDPSKLIYTEDPVILHTSTGRLINFVEDEEHGIRLFWQPPLKEGEDVDPEKAEFLPLGFDEFYGRAVTPPKEGFWKRLVTKMENAWKPAFEKLERWSEEKKRDSEMKLKLIEQELELVEAELCLEEAVEDFETELKRKEKEEEKKVEMTEQDGTGSAKIEEDEEDEDEEEDEDSPRSFGSAVADQDLAKDDKKGNKPGNSPFSTVSLSLASCGFVSSVPSKLQRSFLSWRRGRSMATLTVPHQCEQSSIGHMETSDSINFSRVLNKSSSLKASRQEGRRFRRKCNNISQLHSLARVLSGPKASTKLKSLGEKRCWGHHRLHSPAEVDWSSTLSLPIPLYSLESSCTDIIT